MTVKINDESTNVNGTHLQSYIDISYAEIVDALGEPQDSDGYKVDAEWTIEDEDGTVATIYNYKDGHNYNGAAGLSVEEIRDWHIGGHDEKAVLLVNRVLVKERA
jgi:hypothetical protein